MREQLPRWGCRRPKAVFRGSVNSHYTLNSNWSATQSLRRQHFETGSWQRQGRLALAFQRCEYTVRLRAFSNLRS